MMSPESTAASMGTNAHNHTNYQSQLSSSQQEILAALGPLYYSISWHGLK